jgi:AbrB family looped-hinge helix DNA binding protein
MASQEETKSNAALPQADLGCCRVESIVNVDERGQMVLPKELREKAGIGPGDKLAVVSFQQEGRVCCVCLIKTEGLDDMVRGLLGPLMGEASPGKSG